MKWFIRGLLLNVQQLLEEGTEIIKAETIFIKAEIYYPKRLQLHNR